MFRRSDAWNIRYLIAFGCPLSFLDPFFCIDVAQAQPISQHSAVESESTRHDSLGWQRGGIYASNMKEKEKQKNKAEMSFIYAVRSTERV
jgi:hypothetical protein